MKRIIQKQRARAPGKWDYDMAGCETSHGLPIITKANGHLVATLCEHSATNARLIAAAPELLAALREVEAWNSSDIRGYDDISPNMEMLEARRRWVRAAILRAKGQS